MMKMQGITYYLLISFCFFTLTAKSQLEVFFIGENGMMLQSGDKKVMIDATYNLTDTLEYRVEKALAPFDNIDLFLTTHVHFDHLTPELLLESLSSNPATQAVGEAEFLELLSSSDLYPPVEEQIPTFTPEMFTSVDTVINGIEFTMLRYPHFDGHGDMHNVGYIVKMGGISLFYTGDGHGNYLTEFANFWPEEEAIDVAFFNNEFLNADSGISIVKQVIRPEYLFVTHVPNGNPAVSLVTELQDSIAGVKVSDSTRFIMEGVRFERNPENELFAEVINNKPEKIDVVEGGEVLLDTPFSIQLNKNAFVDPDVDDELKFGLVIINFHEMPEWVTFDAEDLVISGTPDEAGVYRFNLVVTDQYMAETRTTFVIRVLDATGLAENISMQDNALVYPNPADGEIWLENYEYVEEVAIYDISGKKVISEKTAGQSSSINISSLPEGLYMTVINSKTKKAVAEKLWIRR